MRKISLRELVRKLVNNKDIRIYYKDGDYVYHLVSEFDLLSDRLKCEDGEWQLYEWLEDDSLYIE